MIGTIADWRIYATARGNAAPAAASDADATAALTRASDYIMYSYVARFVSPYGVTSPNVEEATYEAANFELTTSGFFSTTFTESQLKVLTGVGSVKWTPVDTGSTARAAWRSAPTSTLIDAMLAAYMPMDIGVAPWFKTIGGDYT